MDFDPLFALREMAHEVWAYHEAYKCLYIYQKPFARLILLGKHDFDWR